MADIEKLIREDWFKDHKATLTQYGDLQVLDWSRPRTNMYGIRYVFDGNRIYISGDLGEAVFSLTWKADIHSFNDVHIGYFRKKLSAYHEDKWDFDSDKAVKELREWLKDLKDNGKKYDHDTMKDLFHEARCCDNCSVWKEICIMHWDFISDLDQDAWEWFYDIGNEYPGRLQGYLIGLKMASEQLKNKEEN